MEFVHSTTSIGAPVSGNIIREVRTVLDWSLIGDRAHVVQFYEEDDVLLDLLSRFVGMALVGGDSAVVIGTKKHREGVVSRLADRGLDVSISRSQGRYVALDAAQTLVRVTRDGHLDAHRFFEALGAVLEAATRAANGGRHRVAVFGEMVALLWAQGKVEDAIRVEELWNKLAEHHAFSLCCAYPMKGFIGNPHAAPFLKICAQHSHVFPAERRVRSSIAAV